MKPRCEKCEYNGRSTYDYPCNECVVRIMDYPDNLDKTDTIYRSAAINVLRKRSKESEGIYGDIGGVLSGVSLLLDRFPSAEIPTGQWKEETLVGLGIEHYHGFKCSNCNYHSEHDFNYCPECGMKMENGRSWSLTNS